MSIIHSHLQTVGGEYNRAADPTLGAIGTINTGVKIPKFCLVNSFQVFVKEDLGTSGANTVSFGFSTTDSPLVLQDPIAFLGATALPLLIPPTVFANASLPILPLRMFNSANLIMVIGGAPGDTITVGRIGFIMTYFEVDF